MASVSASASDRAADERFMLAAHRAARGGWGRTYPNPLVGAVLARGGEEIARGWHAEFGGPHAEVVALERAGARARGSTLYVTLEPCAHTGKQPPCVDAIVAAGIARVVIGDSDPDPIARGGAAGLREAGIVVDRIAGSGPAPYNFRFFHRFDGRDTPFVAVKLAVTMDGLIADANRISRWISSPAARDWVHDLRAGFGAIAVGSATAVTDDAKLTVRGAIRPRLPPSRVVFDRGATLPPEHGIFADVATAPVYMVIGSDVPAARREPLERAGARLVPSDDLGTALRELARRGVDSMLVEGGGRLAGALLEAGLVDRIYQIQSPRWLGQGVPAWSGLRSTSLADSHRWKVLDVVALGTDPTETDVLIELEP
ncbi:MAG: bifunctional diaminohydroxyphosphoribosylaminopyrimidine deaminase/5-amino-6-(5-phosphoribosylamino)uracil reductase RibD [Gemmatimonadales bacterium]